MAQAAARYKGFSHYHPSIHQAALITTPIYLRWPAADTLAYRNSKSFSPIRYIIFVFTQIRFVLRHTKFGQVYLLKPLRTALGCIRSLL